MGKITTTRAREPERAERPYFYFCCVVVFGFMFVLVCWCVWCFCFVRFGCFGFCFCFMFLFYVFVYIYLFTVQSLSKRYSKKLIPQWAIQSIQENRMSDSLALSDVMGSESNEWLHNPWTFVVFAG